MKMTVFVVESDDNRDTNGENQSHEFQNMMTGSQIFERPALYEEKRTDTTVRMSAHTCCHSQHEGPTS